MRPKTYAAHCGTGHELIDDYQRGRERRVASDEDHQNDEEHQSHFPALDQLLELHRSAIRSPLTQLFMKML